MRGLERITEKIISEAQAEAARIIENARQASGEIMLAAGVEADEIKAAIGDKAQSEAESIITGAKSGAALRKRDLLLRTKSDIIDGVYARAYEEIKNLPEEKYCEMVSRLVAKAIIDELATEKTNIELYGAENLSLPEKYELIFNKNDKERFGKTILAGVERVIIGKMDRSVLGKLCIASETAEIDGGVIVRFDSIEANCSLEKVFAAMRERTETEISAYLFSDDKK